MGPTVNNTCLKRAHISKGFQLKQNKTKNKQKQKQQKTNKQTTTTPNKNKQHICAGP